MHMHMRWHPDAAAHVVSGGDYIAETESSVCNSEPQFFGLRRGGFHVQDALCETSYQAEVAALTCEVSPEGAAGLSLRLDGFSHRLPDLAGVVFHTLATMKVRKGS